MDKTEVLRLSVQDIDENQIIISTTSAADHWKFQTGHNPDWKKADVDDTNWKSTTPTTPTLDMADEAGSLEGWIRLKFQLDASLDSIPKLFWISNYGQALDIFLNGRCIHTLGRFGSDTLSYQRAVRSDDRTIVPAVLTADSIHTIAIHYLHMPLGFPANLLQEHMEGKLL